MNWRRSVRIVAAITVPAALALALFLDQWGRRDEPLDHADAIVVLGCGLVAEDTPGPSLSLRVRHAVDLWRAGRAPRILFSGYEDRFRPSQAEAAAHLAGRLGVPREAMWTETKSRDTWENAAFSARVLNDHGWRRVVLVSDPSHLWRASQHFTRYGLTVAVSGAVESDRLGWPIRIAKACREVLSVSRDVVFLRYF